MLNRHQKSTFTEFNEYLLLNPLYCLLLHWPAQKMFVCDRFAKLMPLSRVIPLLASSIFKEQNLEIKDSLNDKITSILPKNYLGNYKNSVL